MNEPLTADRERGPMAAQHRGPAHGRLEIAAQILAGFAANPAVFASNPMNGWELVNCKDSELAERAYKLANELLIVHREWSK